MAKQSLFSTLALLKSRKMKKKTGVRHCGSQAASRLHILYSLHIATANVHRLSGFKSDKAPRDTTAQHHTPMLKICVP